MHARSSAAVLHLLLISPKAKMEATLAVLLLLRLASAATHADASPPTDCPSKCGNVDIPYPFGIGSRCAISTNFTLNCSKTRDGGEKLFSRSREVAEILLPQAQIRLLHPISSQCYNPTNNTIDIDPINSSGTLVTGKTFNSTRNKFTVVGCNTLAYVGVSDSAANNNTYLRTGCVSMCQRPENLRNGSCDGIGCCQTSIPEDFLSYKVRFDTHFNTSSIYSFSRCSYAALIEADSFHFQTSYVSTDAFIKSNGDGKVPVVMDWAIGDGTKCEAAKLNRSSYACVSDNSECVDAANGHGYTCKCTNGYQGNPYLPNGCQDIDECGSEPHKLCMGECMNLNGTYQCICPHGTHSNNPAIESCLPDHKLSPWSEVSDSHLLAGICSSLAILLFFIMCAYTILERKRFTNLKQQYFREHGGWQLLQEIKGQQGVTFKIFRIEELEKATNNFSKNQIFGQGGHGIVYKGVLEDRTMVAIKKAKFMDESQKAEYGKEMFILSQINHKNIVKLLGCCLEVEVPMLVYEFVSNGTLFQLIQEKNKLHPLSLGTRLRIVHEVADSLAYLHSTASPPIIHGDVKSLNILLDENYTAKVSDFGASKLVPKNTNQLATLVQGTCGYLDPEYLQTCKLTAKSDVYSFGVVLLELLTSKRAIYFEEAYVEVSLTSSFLLAMKEKRLSHILDNQIIYGEDNMELILKLCELAKQCLHVSGEERPTMKEVAEELDKLHKSTQHPWVENYEDIDLLLSEPSNDQGNNSTTSYACQEQGNNNTTSYACQELETLDISIGR